MCLYLKDKNHKGNGFPCDTLYETVNWTLKQNRKGINIFTLQY